MTVLDKRLAAVAEEMTLGGVGVDVGTDHGYLAVHLVETGRAARMLATDINPQPLESARRCVAEAGLTDRIETVLTSGLEGLDLEPVTDVFIAGMGGVLITEILAARHPVRAALSLQPMTQAPALRQWLLENGYEIRRERCAVSAGRPYTVIHAAYDGQVRKCDPLFALVGLAGEDDSPDAGADLRRQLDRLAQKANGLARAAGGETERAETLALMDELRQLIAKQEERLA